MLDHGAGTVKMWQTFCTPYNFIKYSPIFTFFTVRVKRKS